jgi:tetratricopeptide (TPR) repeat protein
VRRQPPVRAMPATSPVGDLLRQARQAHGLNDLPRAEALYRAVLATDPNQVDVIGSLAAICHQTGRGAQAIELFSRALRLRPRAPDILANLGVVLLAAGRADEALARCDQALAELPGHPALHDNRGNALRMLGRYVEALAAYDRAIALAPGFAEAHDNRGVALEDLKRYPEALAAHEQALALRPNSARALYNRAAVLLRLKRPREALESADRALALQPNFPEALNNRGVALIKLHHPEAALAAFDRALALKPDYHQAARNRGMALVELHRPDEALAACEQLFAEDLTALQVRAAALIELNRPDEAVDDLDRALPDDDDPAAAWTLRGHALHKLGRFEDALASYHKALQLDPDNSICQWNLSNAELTQGNFAAGWRGYEARWQLDDLTPPVGAPPWLGDEDIAGKTLLIHSEQGYGDTIQFCRYASLVAERGATVLLRVQPALKELMLSLPGVARVMDTNEPLPAFDLYCPIVSLPLALGTTLESIPASIPYLEAAPELVARWGGRLGNGGRSRIGLVVSGNPGHKNDRNRSVPLASLRPVLEQEAQWVLVQQAVGDRDITTLAERPDIRYFGEELRSFADTAAVIANLDLIISVDTSVAHLAGALGKPVWILLPSTPDWRWLLNRTDSPWYPTARLFRQSRLGDWPDVIGQVRAALAAHFGSD